MVERVALRLYLPAQQPPERVAISQATRDFAPERGSASRSNMASQSVQKNNWSVLQLIRLCGSQTRAPVERVALRLCLPRSAGTLARGQVSGTRPIPPPCAALAAEWSQRDRFHQ